VASSICQALGGGGAAAVAVVAEVGDSSLTASEAGQLSEVIRAAIARVHGICVRRENVVGQCRLSPEYSPSINDTA